MEQAILYPGYDQAAQELTTLIGAGCCCMPFIYIHDEVNPRLCGFTICDLILRLSSKLDDSAEDAAQSLSLHVQVNAVACFIPRLLFNSILNALIHHAARGLGPNNTHMLSHNFLELANNARGKWSDSFDQFVHGLHAIVNEVKSTVAKRRSVNEKDDEGTNESGPSNQNPAISSVQITIVIEKAEKLKETMPELLVPLTRLSEMACLPITVIFISQVRWDDLKPSLGASPDPYFISIPPLTKNDIVAHLMAFFSSTSSTHSSSLANPNPYHPIFLPLYRHFAGTLYDVCSLYAFGEPEELAYVAAARWPGFVQPLLDRHSQSAEESEEELDFLPPSEEDRMYLITMFKSSFGRAFEVLYSRLQHAGQWARAERLAALDEVTQEIEEGANSNDKVTDNNEAVGLDLLSRTARFVLLAAFLASTNPSKFDMRMFGRGLDEKKRRRRKGFSGPGAGGKKSGTAKVPQRLLGPMSFPLDRMQAILGILLEGYDVDSRLPAPHIALPGEYTELEIGRSQVYGIISELSAMRLLHRTSPSDKLDGPPTYKCSISYENALQIARDLDVPLNDLMWDPA